MSVQPVARSVDSLVRKLASWSIWAHEITPTEQRALLSWFRTRQNAMTDRIGSLLENGNRRAARRLAGQLRRSLPARFVALHGSVPKAFRAKEHSSSEERETLRVEALQWVLDQLEEVGELNVPASARVRLVPKKHEMQPGQTRSFPADLRAIFSFGYVDNARQRLLYRSLLPFVDFHPSQYLIQSHAEGRGRSGVCEALRLQLPAMASDTVFLHLDVRNFYGSIDHRWLERALGVPEDVVRGQVHTGAMSIRYLDASHNHVHPSDGVRKELFRRGIPGGSALSSLIGELVMADVLRGLSDLPQGTLLFTYSDNLGVFCPASATHVIEDLFRERFAAHGAGPFALTAGPPVSIKSEFRFLGHWWRLRDNRLEVYVPPAVAETKLVSIAGDALVASASELMGLARSVRQQASEWCLWPGAANWVKAAMEIVKNAATSPGPIIPIAPLLDLERRALESLQPVARRETS